MSTRTSKSCILKQQFVVIKLDFSPVCTVWVDGFRLPFALLSQFNDYVFGPRNCLTLSLRLQDSMCSVRIDVRRCLAGRMVRSPNHKFFAFIVLFGFRVHSDDIYGLVLD